VVLRALSNIDRCVADIPEEAKFGNQVRYQPQAPHSLFVYRTYKFRQSGLNGCDI
jgi:hypothetical protein